MSTTTDPVEQARREYNAWCGVIPAHVARRNATLRGTTDADKAWWLAYAAEVDVLQGNAPCPS